MADTQFLTDVKTLRDRARKHMEQGAVTPGYSADRTKVIELLNDAMATEIASGSWVESLTWRPAVSNAGVTQST